MSQNLARPPGETPGKTVSPSVRDPAIWVQCWRASDARKPQAAAYYAWVMEGATADDQQLRIQLLMPAAQAYAHRLGHTGVLKHAQEALEAMGSAAA